MNHLLINHFLAEMANHRCRSATDYHSCAQAVVFFYWGNVLTCICSLIETLVQIFIFYFHYSLSPKIFIKGEIHKWDAFLAGLHCIKPTQKCAQIDVHWTEIECSWLGSTRGGVGGRQLTINFEQMTCRCDQMMAIAHQVFVRH